MRKFKRSMGLRMASAGETNYSSQQWKQIHDWVEKNKGRIAKQGTYKASVVASKGVSSFPQGFADEGWTPLKSLKPSQAQIEFICRLYGVQYEKRL